MTAACAVPCVMVANAVGGWNGAVSSGDCTIVVTEEGCCMLFKNL